MKRTIKSILFFLLCVGLVSPAAGQGKMLSLSANGMVLTGTATHGNDAPRTVFEVSLSDDGTGAFRFVSVSQRFTDSEKNSSDHITGPVRAKINSRINHRASDKPVEPALPPVK